MSRDRHCAREGCPRKRRPGHEHCTILCAVLADEFAYLERLLTNQDNAAHPLATEAWTTLVGIGDSLSRYRSLVSAVYGADVRRRFPDKVRRPRRGAGPEASSVATSTDSSPS